MNAYTWLLCGIIVLTGCSAEPDKPSPSPVPTQSTRAHFEFSEVPFFERGEARIVPNMTKEAVLAEIPKSGLDIYKHRCRLRDPDLEMQKQDVWPLLYGSGGGATPGTYMLRITFEDNRIVTLEHAAVARP